MRRVLAALFVSGLLMTACGSATGSRPSPTPTPPLSPAPSASPTANPTPTPVTSPSPTAAPSPTPPSGFVCTTVSGGEVSTSTVATVRVGQHPGYDRFVIEFGSGVPSYSVTPQKNAAFSRSPKGDQVTLEGTDGVLIVIHSVTNWTSYPGPSAFHPGFPYLRQAMLVENYEGYQQWALGIQGTPCLRVAVFNSPARLVVDIAAI